MKSILCLARYVVTKQMFDESNGRIVEHVRDVLANNLASHILRDNRFFKEYPVENFEKEYRANCYVLTEAEFDELVRVIESRLLHHMPPIMGGIFEVEL